MKPQFETEPRLRIDSRPDCFGLGTFLSSAECHRPSPRNSEIIFLFCNHSFSQVALTQSAKGRFGSVQSRRMLLSGCVVARNPFGFPNPFIWTVISEGSPLSFVPRTTKGSDEEMSWTLKDPLNLGGLCPSSDGISFISTAFSFPQFLILFIIVYATFIPASVDVDYFGGRISFGLDVEVDAVAFGGVDRPAWVNG